MKKLKAFLGILLAVGLITSCSKTDTSKPKDDGLITLSTRSNPAAVSFKKANNGEVVIDKTNLENLAALTKQLYPSDKNVNKVFNVSWMHGKTMSYLTYEGFDAAANRIKKYAVGINLHYSEAGELDGAILVDKETHKCEGAPCSCCEYVKNGDKIVGCNCWNPDPPQGSLCAKQDGQKCNHTVSTASVD